MGRSRQSVGLHLGDAKIREELRELRKEHKAPNGVVPSTRTLKAHDVFTQRVIHDLSHDPVAELVNLAKFSSSEKLRAEINIELLQYMIPKLKAVDTNPNAGEMIQINVVMPGQTQPEEIHVLRPGSLPPVSSIESNQIYEED